MAFPFFGVDGQYMPFSLSNLFAKFRKFLKQSQEKHRRTGGCSAFVQLPFNQKSGD